MKNVQLETVNGLRVYTMELDDKKTIKAEETPDGKFTVTYLENEETLNVIRGLLRPQVDKIIRMAGMRS